MAVAYSDLSVGSKIIIWLTVVVLVGALIGIITWVIITYAPSSTSKEESSETSSSNPILNALVIQGSTQITSEVDTGAEGTCFSIYSFVINRWKTLKPVFVSSANDVFSNAVIQERTIEVDDSGQLESLPYSFVFNLQTKGTFKITIASADYDCLFFSGRKFTVKLYKANPNNTIERTLLVSNQVQNNGSPSGTMSGFEATTELNETDIVYILIYSESYYMNYSPFVKFDKL